MHRFVKRVSQKISKLSPAQVEDLFMSITEENESFSSVFDSISNGLVIVDKKFEILKWNKAAERYLHFKIRLEENKLPEIPFWELLEDEEIAKFVKKTFDEDRTNVSREFTISTSGGTVRFITITITPLVAHFSAVGSIISISDNTEKRNQEVLLHRMESLSSLTNLAASVAHEIKNPLGAISIHIQLIQKALKKARDGDGMLPDKKFVENYLDVVNEEIDNLNKIVVDFLFAVRPVSATLELLNPNKLLAKFMEFYKPEFEQNKIEVAVDLFEDDLSVLIDNKLFRDVITNIVQNAIAAIKERRESDDFSEFSAKFGICTKIKDDKFVILISDNGLGMSQETVSHIFEPYYTTKANGTGLGMTMVYKIIKEFSGEIEVSSERGVGTQFLITLPIPQTETLLLANVDNTIQG